MHLQPAQGSRRRDDTPDTSGRGSILRGLFFIFIFLLSEGVGSQSRR